MYRHLNTPHIRELIDSHEMFAIVGEDAETYVRLVESYPWKGTGLDWAALKLLLAVSSADTIGMKRLQRRLECTASHLVLIFGQCEAIAGTVENVLAHFDELVWTTPGRRYFVGASLTAGKLRSSADLVVEFDGAETVRLFGRFQE